MKVLVIIQGHYRSFDKTVDSWMESLKNCDFEFRISVFDRIDHNTVCWWKGEGQETPLLTLAQIETLKKLDPGVEIITQYLSPEERADLYAHKPLKSHYYRYNAWKKILENIDETKYDVIVLSRPDVLIKDIDFNNLSIEVDEIKVCGRSDPNRVHGLAGTDVICAIHPKNKDVFYDVPSDFVHRKFISGEDSFNDFIFKKFGKVDLYWSWGKEYEIYEVCNGRGIY